MSDNLQIALAERDEILKTMDIERAKEFIAKHGGVTPKNANWELVMHLARWETTTLPEDLKMDSRIYLARSGNYGIGRMNPKNTNVRAAMDLLFPKTLTDAFIASLKQGEEEQP